LHNSRHARVPRHERTISYSPTALPNASRKIAQADLKHHGMRLPPTKNVAYTTKPDFDQTKFLIAEIRRRG
jgi:hypothetical protein